MSLLAAWQDGASRSCTLRLLCGACVLSAALGMLVYVGAIELVEGMVEDRLQLSFQYANAAGAWFAVGTLLCVLAPGPRDRRMACLPATGLLLTQSVGALLVFGVVGLFLVVDWARRGSWEFLGQTLIAVPIALASFALLHLLRTQAMAVLLIAVQVAYVGCGNRLLADRGARTWRRIAAGALVALAAAAVLVVVLFRTRLGQASVSIAERFYHVRDGLAVWVQHPLLGIGPDTWRYLYPYVQTAQYYATVVHSSYVQMLLDAGVLGLGAFAAAAVMGVRSQLRARGKGLPGNGLTANTPNAAAAKPHAAGYTGRESASGSANRTVSASDSSGELAPSDSVPHTMAATAPSPFPSSWHAAELVAVSFLLIYAALEFILQFASLAWLLAYLLSADGPAALAADCGEIAGGSPTSAPTRSWLRGRATGIACLVLLLPLCALGTFVELQHLALDVACASGDMAACQRIYKASPFVSNDAAARETMSQLLFDQGRYDAVLALYQGFPTHTASGILQAARAAYGLGQRDEAVGILLAGLEDQPCNVDLYNQAGGLFVEWGLAAEQLGRYHAAVGHANELVSQVSASLPQERVSAYV